MGLPQPSVGPEIAEVQRVLEKSGLEYKTLRGIKSYFELATLSSSDADIVCAAPSGYGTNIEGPWDDVMRVIGEAHQAVHAMGCQRIATDIRIGTRTDKSITSGGNDGKVSRVEGILAADKKQ
ncbi:hypothetical protein I316_06989 [Kwoniella heveanensis BCC8398]|uniref:Thiamine-binding protein domain-containing protein n=1 Tax=Kwoniella heveanensis BCC8398 TaxID=1296120 RepID=A0A1B9GK02_9TREE|nr:hypothetical protein I316_06989 [Kwoniella heveanensis BCC8398]